MVLVLSNPFEGGRKERSFAPPPCAVAFDLCPLPIENSDIADNRNIKP